MATDYCTNNINSAKNISDLLNTAYNDKKFKPFFIDDIGNKTLLFNSCGLSFNADLGTAVKYPNDDIFYNFWNGKDNVSSLTNALLDYAGGFTSKQFINEYFDLLNPIYYFLLYYLFCIESKHYSNQISKEAIFVNWQFFLAHNRGVASLEVCDFCIKNQFIPLTINDPSKAGEIVRTHMANDPVMKNWCGCCVPRVKEYTYPEKIGKKYNFLNPFISDDTTFPLYCESICDNPDYNNIINGNQDIIPLINGNKTYVNASGVTNGGDIQLTYDQPTCNANICVIDNITINSVGTKGKGITFNQVCPGCVQNNSGCICYSYGNDVFDKIKAGNGSMEDPVIFKQYCPNSLCYKKQVNNKFQEVKCNSVSPANTGKGGDIDYNGNGLFNNLDEANIYGVDTWLFPISLTSILIVFFIAAIFTTLYRNQLEPNKKQVTEKP